ncbi:hypothetical protein JHW43_006304 [Diplocarpon mali]|nr:hypothetical protein JHW43_006304 [Diplocarpon mali]
MSSRHSADGTKGRHEGSPIPDVLGAFFLPAGDRPQRPLRSAKALAPLHQTLLRQSPHQQTENCSNSKFANENTSGAPRLDPASEAEARMAEEHWAEEEEKLGAAATSYQTQPSSGHHRPKGSQLDGGGGVDRRDSKNAGFYSEVGSRNDPGRLAEQKVQRDNAGASADAGFPKQQGTADNNAYDSLGGDASA